MSKGGFLAIVCALSITALCACSSSVDFKPQYASGAELNPRFQGVPAVLGAAPNGPLKIKEDGNKNLSLNSGDPKPAVEPPEAKQQKVKVKRVYVPYYDDYFYRPWFRPYMGWHWWRPWRHRSHSHFGVGLGFGF